MSLYHDPEGIESVLNPTSTMSLIIPADREVFLCASFDSSWEQAVVLYLGAVRYEYQLGSYILRPSYLTIPKQPADYELSLVAWHKRSNPNALLPWIASKGRRIGPVVFAWDDSADDEDYRDTRIKLLTS